MAISPWPIAGTRICAGFPSRADDFLDGEIDLARILTPNRAATFLWRVAGHSMKETGIHDGDVVVASINGEVSLKLFRNDGRPTLSFANRDMPVFFLADTADVEVWGVVTWTLHQPRLP